MSTIEIGFLFPGHSEIKMLSSGSTYEGWDRGPNHVNGVGVKHDYFNASEKDIKYLTFVYEAYNQVDDVVTCQTSGETEGRGKLTGPIKSHEKYEVKWDALWYNPTITKVVIKEIHVQYMDNSEETIPGDQLLSLYDDNSEYKKQEDARKAAEAAEKAAEEARKQQQKEEALQALNGLKDSVVGGLKGLFKKK